MVYIPGSARSGRVYSPLAVPKADTGRSNDINVVPSPPVIVIGTLATSANS
jgi:hypothetical protein